jgi:hypothetical protein
MITKRRVRPLSAEQRLEMIRGEFAALPGLRLTSGQAQRVWGLDATDCDNLLQTLLTVRFLVRNDDGTYMRADVSRMLTTLLPPTPRVPRQVA